MGLDDPLVLSTLFLAVATFIGSVGIMIGIWFNKNELQRNERINSARFYLMLRQMLSQYDDIRTNLRPGGKWGNKERGPESEEEWSRVSSYMGLFEHCNSMIKYKLIDIETFKSIYLPRILQILHNRVITDHHLKLHKDKWRDFIELCERLKFNDAEAIKKYDLEGNLKDITDPIKIKYIDGPVMPNKPPLSVLTSIKPKLTKLDEQNIKVTVCNANSKISKATVRGNIVYPSGVIRTLSKDDTDANGEVSWSLPCNSEVGTHKVNLYIDKEGYKSEVLTKSFDVGN